MAVERVLHAFLSCIPVYSMNYQSRHLSRSTICANFQGLSLSLNEPSSIMFVDDSTVKSHRIAMLPNTMPEGVSCRSAVNLTYWSDFHVWILQGPILCWNPANSAHITPQFNLLSEDRSWKWILHLIATMRNELIANFLTAKCDVLNGTITRHSSGCFHVVEVV